MLAKRIEDLRAADFTDLVQDEVAESLTLEFKREIPGTTAGENVKILRGITALANTSGGDLLYGIEEDDSVAVAIPGLPSSGIGAQIQRIENLLRQGVDPPLMGAQIQPIDIGNDRCVLIVRVPKSWAGPHRVTSGGSAHFYGRNSKESYPLEVAALRAAFGQSELLLERAEGFLAERTMRLVNRETVRPVHDDGALLALHILPLASFAPGSNVNVWPLSGDRTRDFLPLGMEIGCVDPTFEGFVLFEARRGPSTGYCHVHRSGCIEIASILRPGGFENDPVKRWMLSPWIEQVAVLNTERFTGALEKYNVAAPFIAALTLIGAEQYALDVEGAPFRGNHQKLGVKLLRLPPIYMETRPADASAIWRPVLDRIYNAFGQEGSPFWRDGAWTARRT